jgi:hypothetical protein
LTFANILAKKNSKGTKRIAFARKKAAGAALSYAM